MIWPFSIWSKPVGRKNTEAITGMVLLLFMVEHLAGNLLLLSSDPGPYRWYTSTMGHSIVVRVLEVALFALFAVHIGLGLKMRLHFMRMKRTNKFYRPPTNVTTRFVGTTGAAILLFLVIHLWRFFVPNRIVASPTYDLYTDVHAAFSNAWYTGFYVVSMAMLGFHLVHGIRSAVVSFKRLPPPLIKRIRSLASWIAGLVSAGLAYIAVHICMFR